MYKFQVVVEPGVHVADGERRRYEGAGETTVTVAADLPNNATQYWRARAMDAETLGDWSVVQVFRTPNVAPAPGPPPTPSPGGGGGAAARRATGPRSWPASRRSIRDQLAAGRARRASGSRTWSSCATGSSRPASAAGSNLGWNLKRGGPERSVDFLAWQRGDGDMGIDIGFDYDNTSTPLRLQWGEAGLGATFQRLSGTFHVRGGAGVRPESPATRTIEACEVDHSYLPGPRRTFTGR